MIELTKDAVDVVTGIVAPVGVDMMFESLNTGEVDLGADAVAEPNSVDDGDKDVPNVV